MFRLEVLPAAHGDAIWLEYGDPRTPRRIVVDGEPAATYETGLHKRLLLLPVKDRRIDLLVVTHIDTDHIDGAIILLQAAEQLGINFGEIWFNGWEQLAKEKEQTEGLKPLRESFSALSCSFLGIATNGTVSLKGCLSRSPTRKNRRRGTFLTKPR